MNSANVILSKDLCVLEDKVDKNKYSYSVKINEYNLPLRKDDYVGKIYVKMNDKVISSENLSIDRDVNKLSVFNYILKNIRGLLFGI